MKRNLKVAILSVLMIVFFPITLIVFLFMLTKNIAEDFIE